jgi:hypothetical protein
MKVFLQIVLCPILFLPLIGCGVLLGEVKPVEERTTHYSYTDPSSLDRDWEHIRQAPKSHLNAQSVNHESSDAAFQSKSTGSIISTNSVCRQNHSAPLTSLKDYATELFIGFDTVENSRDVPIEIDGIQGLETIADTSNAGQATKVRSVVLQKGSCLFDFIYLSAPASYDTHNQQFETFLKSIKMR